MAIPECVPVFTSACLEGLHHCLKLGEGHCFNKQNDAFQGLYMAVNIFVVIHLKAFSTLVKIQDKLK